MPEYSDPINAEQGAHCLTVRRTYRSPSGEVLNHYPFRPLAEKVVP